MSSVSQNSLMCNNRRSMRSNPGSWPLSVNLTSICHCMHHHRFLSDGMRDKNDKKKLKTKWPIPPLIPQPKSLYIDTMTLQWPRVMVNLKPLRLMGISWDRWGTETERWVSGCDSPITMVTSLISITPSLWITLSPPLSFFPLTSSLLVSPLLLIPLRVKSEVAPRPWNVSPHQAWHLQIRAHYLGVTCPVPFKYRATREGRMWVHVSMHLCVLQFTT